MADLTNKMHLKPLFIFLLFLSLKQEIQPTEKVIVYE